MILLPNPTMNQNNIYIWSRRGWPGFTFRTADLLPKLMAVREKRAELLGAVRSFGFPAQVEAAIAQMTLEVVASSAIEGVALPAEAVRSSLVLRLGAHQGGLPHAGARRVDPVVGILVEAAQGWDRPLTLERILGWHRELFVDGTSRHLGTIRAGAFRTAGTMAVVSQARRPDAEPVIHFEAPPWERLEAEVAAFLHWFAHPPEGLDGLLRAAITHFWFVTLHPFEDGNGRIARTLGDLALAQEDRSALRFYSLSARILRHRPAYYEALERAQKGGLDLTDWIAWFLEELGQALEAGLREARLVLARSLFWAQASRLGLNERQEAGLRRALGPRGNEDAGEEGTLSNRRYRAATGANRITSTRDLAHLVDLGLLVPHGAGRGAAYRVPLERFLPPDPFAPAEP